MERSFLGLAFLCTSRVGRQSGIGNKALFCSWILVVMPRMDRVSVVGHYFFFLPAQRDDDRQGYLLFIFMMQHSCVGIITFNHIMTVTIYWFWKQGRLGRERWSIYLLSSVAPLSAKPP